MKNGAPEGVRGIRAPPQHRQYIYLSRLGMPWNPSGFRSPGEPHQILNIYIGCALSDETHIKNTRAAVVALLSFYDADQVKL